jgi:hypothetical protein
MLKDNLRFLSKSINTFVSLCNTQTPKSGLRLIKGTRMNNTELKKQFLELYNVGVVFARSPRNYTTAMIGYADRIGLELTDSDLDSMNALVKRKGDRLGRHAGGKTATAKNTQMKPGLHFYHLNTRIKGGCYSCSCDLINGPIISVSDPSGVTNYCLGCGVTHCGHDELMKNTYYRSYDKKNSHKIIDALTKLTG